MDIRRRIAEGQIPGSYAITISNWDTVATPDDRMTGHFSEDWRYTSSYMSGVGRFDVELLTVTKTSGSAAQAAIQPVMPQTLEEMARAMRIR